MKMHIELSPEEVQCLIDYARRKFAEERFPLSPELQPVREVLSRFEPKPAPLPERKPYVPSLLAERKKRKRR